MCIYYSFSKRAKSLLASYQLSPTPFVVELDQRSDGPVIQEILARLTGRRTVPNVLLQVCTDFQLSRSTLIS